MILTELRDYLRRNRRAAVYDLALHFDVDADVVRGLLNQWERRGKVQRLPSGTACGGGCSRCDPAAVELYEWRE